MGEFKLAEIAQATCKLREDLNAVYDRMGDEAASCRMRVNRELDARAEASTVTIAFVGQYSAGKSTMLSALTGRNDICVDADIATDVATAYNWRGLVLVDTPGLYTERKEHDDTTLAALRQADLLVFCITSNLFDNLVLAQFRELTSTHDFAPKVFLVVNKMSAEAGDWDQRVAAYTRSLDEALAPDMLDAYPHAFTDARDYLEGVQFDEPELIDDSRFKSFVDGLHEFATSRGVVARYDTPLRIMQQGVQDAMRLATRDDDGDDAFLLLVAKVGRSLRETRGVLRAAVSEHTFALSGRIQEIGRNYLEQAAEAEELDHITELTNASVRAAMEATSNVVEKEIANHLKRLQASIDEVLDSDLARGFAARVDQPDGDFDVLESKEERASRQAWSQLNELGSKSAGVLAKAAQGPASSVGGGFLAAKEVAGSTLHDGVYAIGKFFGHNFRPWEAVNIAKDLGNIAAAGGVILSVAGFAYDAYADHQAMKKEEEAADARLSVSRSFRTMASRARDQFHRVLEDQVEPELFGPIEARLAELRRERLAIRARDKEVGELLRTLEDDIRGMIARVHGMEGSPPRRFRHVPREKKGRPDDLQYA